ncbi:MAG: hypothetical protein IJA58_06460, partial [Lachnospiraceae bacterium]|nr:hypothetical protein [Lachnospiraceae bacterium]
FVEYVGYVENKLTIVRPVNGQNYDTYILNQYFDLVIDGPTGADDVTLAAIAAINAIPERVVYEDKALVEAARAAYAKIATTEQQALVKNYAALVSAEQRIVALTPDDPVGGDVVDPSDDKTDKTSMIMGIVLAGLALIGTVGGLVITAVKAPKKEKTPKKAKTPKEKKVKKSKKAAEETVQVNAEAETEMTTDATAEAENTETEE